ncbi:MAG: chromophore lyase CpcT/CpeT [Pseudomonadota bacterium]
MLRIVLKILILIAFSTALTPGSIADDAENPFARDILILTDWFEGEFDNEEQRWFHWRSRAKGEPAVRIHTIHKRMNAPQFGDHVFYVEEYKDNDPADLVRQRIVIFSAQPTDTAIRMQQGFFKDAKSLIGAHNDPEKFTQLKKKDVFFMDSCDVFFTRDAAQFKGAMKDKACVFGKGEKERYSVHNLTLSQEKYWRVDATFLTADDSFYAGTQLDQPLKMRRARVYVCALRFFDDKRNEQLVDNLRVHSQGGIATAIRTSDGASFDILLREKEYPFYDTRPDFIYYSIRRTGAQRSVAYGVADAGSRQFGANIGELSAFCHREGFTFLQSLEQLDD